MNKQHKSGFTLLELSIVLVIIGMLLGGLMVGKSLMRNSQIQSIITDYDKINAAVLQFKTTYDYLPGDFPNASKYWGAATQCSMGGTPLTNGTCNGNGNGILGGSGRGDPSEPDGPNPSFDWYHGEQPLFWQHITMAKMFPGTYDGTIGNPLTQTTDDFVPNPSWAPFSRIDGACFYVNASAGYSGGNYYSNQLRKKNVITFGKPRNPVAGIYSAGCIYGAITPLEAYNIDSKIDDGKPDSGKISIPAWSYFTSGFSFNRCSTGSPYQYNISDHDPDCEFFMEPKF